MNAQIEVFLTLLKGWTNSNIIIVSDWNINYIITINCITTNFIIHIISIKLE